jgi:hypothetical protein
MISMCKKAATLMHRNLLWFMYFYLLFRFKIFCNFDHLQANSEWVSIVYAHNEVVTKYIMGYGQFRVKNAIGLSFSAASINFVHLSIQIQIVNIAWYQDKCPIHYAFSLSSCHSSMCADCYSRWLGTMIASYCSAPPLLRIDAMFHIQLRRHKHQQCRGGWIWTTEKLSRFLSISDKMTLNPVLIILWQITLLWVI